MFDLPDFGCVGMAGETLFPLTKKDTIDIPYGSELMMLPSRKPIVYSFETKEFEVLEFNPYEPDEEVYPVAVFNSPGYVNKYFPAYENEKNADLLPLFSYGATGYGKNGFQSAAILIDDEPRQDLRLMPQKKITAGIKAMQKKYPDNRLMRHLENCATEYSCPAGKNFFLKRYEAPLPTARACNARCLGCISLQEENLITSPQNRIKFTPSSKEISEVATEHIKTVENPVVSFGQGCEGDPLTAFKVIEPAVKIIRKKTSLGTINFNSNASMPDLVEKLFDAGLDSMRVSINSIQEKCYNAYFRPNGYEFKDVLKSIKTGLEKKKFIALNYINCPGFTDSELEFEALVKFLNKFPVSMIQWRNMNYDPQAYCKTMFEAGGKSSPLGIEFVIDELKKLFPNLIHGYFNPPKEKHEK
ncbi:MAG: radical SAM protein [Desulfobacteraceae bacterium]|nr:radical SAM protein [Desulfobacteraceae bacterium]